MDLQQGMRQDPNHCTTVAYRDTHSEPKTSKKRELAHELVEPGYGTIFEPRFSKDVTAIRVFNHVDGKTSGVSGDRRAGYHRAPLVKTGARVCHRKLLFGVVDRNPLIVLGSELPADGAKPWDDGACVEVEPVDDFVDLLV